MSKSIQKDNERAERIRAMRRRTALAERQREYWTQEEKEQLKRLFEAGIGISEIALELKRTEEAVMQQIHTMNLYERVRRPNRGKKSECLCKKCLKHQECDRSSCPAEESSAVHNEEHE